MNEQAVRKSLLMLFAENVANWEVLSGVAYGLSHNGLGRVDIMRFFWSVMSEEERLTEQNIDLIGDFCRNLLGQCPARDIVRLHNDPEDETVLAEKVTLEARLWVAPHQK